MDPGAPLLQVYWRPGCGACTSLRLALNDAGISANWHNIRQDPADAAWLRGVARGFETVPTVVYEDRVVVAPRPDRVVEDLRSANPDLPIRPYRAWPPLRILQWVTIILLVAGSEALALTGRSALSWGADALAIAVYFTVRALRLRQP